MPSQQSQLTLAQISYDNHLFVEGWELKPKLLDIIENGENSNYWISVLFLRKKPVATICLHKTELYISVYVDPMHRGKNLGIKIIEQLLHEHNLRKDQVHAFLGEDGTFDFFKKAGIACFDSDIKLSPVETSLFLKHELSYAEIKQRKINQRLDDYKNNVPHPEYQQIYPRTVPKIHK